MTTTIPFSGFYESMHSHELDRALEDMVSDSSGCHPVSERIANDLWMHCNYPFQQYAKEFIIEFAEYFKQVTGIELTGWKPDGMESPREYNFTTDRIFAKLPYKTVKLLFDKCDKAILDAIIKKSFTSYDGFISFYEPNRAAWGPLKTWDHNQVGCILRALVAEHFSKEWEWALVENWSGNGDISNWMYDGLDEEGKRLVKIADYLRKREERSFTKV